MIPYENLKDLNAIYADEINQAIKKVIDSGYFILGEETEKFEDEFSSYLGVSECIGVGNGLDALTLAIKALELPDGAEVIVQSNTYIATVLSIINNNLVPVFVEPDIYSYSMTVSGIAEKITRKTKAILVTHLYGKISDMIEINMIAALNGLYVIEDCAQSHGSTLNGKHSGTFGHIGCYSFYPTKNLGALGDGGAIVTNDKAIAVKLRKLRNYGSSKKYYNELQGVNSRLDELQAAVLRVKLRHLEAYIDKKNSLANIYFENLDQHKFTLPKREKNKRDTFHIFPIRTTRRDDVREHLMQNEIGTEIHYPVPLNLQPALCNYINESFEIAERISSSIISLPCSIIHSELEISKVVRTLNEHF